MITNKAKIQIINLILIIIVSIGVNQYLGNIGIFPIDSFFPFNASYEMPVSYTHLTLPTKA